MTTPTTIQPIGAMSVEQVEAEIERLKAQANELFDEYQALKTQIEGIKRFASEAHDKWATSLRKLGMMEERLYRMRNTVSERKI